MLVFLSSAVLCALYTGFLLSSLAAVLLALGHIFFYQTPRRTLSLPTEADMFEILFFLACAIFVGWLSSATSKAIDRAERATREATEASRTREDFLAIVSHDLKNPLHAIAINAELLLRNPTLTNDPSAWKSSEAIQRSANTAITLIRDLLDYEKIRANRLAVEPREICIKDLIQGVVEMMSPILSRRSQKLIVGNPGGELKAFIDPERMHQVLGNLLGNASKFTGEGGIIELRWSKRDEELHFLVRDNGPGIPPEEQKQVFDRYWQARQHTQLGTGLGLSIVKGIIEAHGGRIWLESPPGEGASFRFFVPCEARRSIAIEQRSSA